MSVFYHQFDVIQPLFFKVKQSFWFDIIIFDKPYTSNVKIITEIIEDQCRLLRLSPNTRKDYCDQILFELKII